MVNLDGKSIEEYLHKIKGYIDELASVGIPIRHEEYVDALLEGLPSDYVLVISVIESKKHTPSIAKIEALLYGHETRLTRYNRDTPTTSFASLHYTQGYSHPNTYKIGGFRDSHGRDGDRGTFSDVLDVGVVALAEATVVVVLLTSNAKFVSNKDTLQMFAISGLMLAFNHMIPSLFLNLL